MIELTCHGRLVKNPSTEYSNDGKPRCSFTIACDYYFGEKKTTFIMCKLFGKRAETFAEHMKKGASVVLKGDLDISQYNDKWYTTCLVKDFEFGAKPRQESGGYNQDYPQNNDDGSGEIPF